MHTENQVLSETIDFLVILVSFDFVVVLCSLDCLDLFSLFCFFVVVVVFLQSHVRVHGRAYSKQNKTEPKVMYKIKDFFSLLI